jgi:hypothetical protein
MLGSIPLTMLTVPLISQQSVPIANTLGTSKLSIASYGCALTCLAVLAGRTDLTTVNDLLVKAGAIVNDKGGPDNASLVYWVKVPGALPNLKFVWRGWSYDNAKVRDWIAKGYPVIVQVDAAPIGAPRSTHFVVYLGDQKLFDPWTGKIRPTWDFPIPQGYVLYEVAKPVLTPEQKLEAIKQICFSNKVADEQIKAIKALVL